MGWFTSNTTIHFRLSHNLSIDAILEDPYLSYSLDNFEADLTRDNIESIDTAIAVWMGGPIPEYITVEAIKQILLDSTEFKSLKVYQFQLMR